MSASAPIATRRFLTPARVAEDLGVDLRKVLAWIKTGELHAVNLATRADGRKPRWRIAAVALETFLLRRSATPTPATPRRRRKDSATIEFF